jgi:hypothetical protein
MYAGAQFDQRAVDARQGIAEPEAPLPLACDLRAAAEQRCEHFLAQLPRPVLVGVTQRGSLGRLGAVQERGAGAVLLDHRCPISEAEPYGDMLTCPHGHYERLGAMAKKCEKRERPETL